MRQTLCSIAISRIGQASKKRGLDAEATPGATPSTFADEASIADLRKAVIPDQLIKERHFPQVIRVPSRVRPAHSSHQPITPKKWSELPRSCRATARSRYACGWAGRGILKVTAQGPVAQLGARFHGMEEVVSSNLTRSTKAFQALSVFGPRRNSRARSPGKFSKNHSLNPSLSSSWNPTIRAQKPDKSRLTGTDRDGLSQERTLVRTLRCTRRHRVPANCSVSTRRGVL
jgi:hypothetical protein